MPLGDAALRSLIAELIGQHDSVTALIDRVVTWTTGKPFYAEEMLHELVDSGGLAGQLGDYQLTTPLDHLVVPTNVLAVLAARIDRLPDPAKRLLHTAAVIGKELRGPLLDAVHDLALADYAPALERLKDGEMVYEQAALLAYHCEAANELLGAARWHQRVAEWTGLNDPKVALDNWQRARDLIRRLAPDHESTLLLAQACSSALAGAHDCYTRFNMSDHAASVEGMMRLGSSR